MSEIIWTQVDDYLNERLIGPDAALNEALSTSESAGLPAIAVSACQGRMLELLARTAGARRILEVGTLGGYSTIFLARALPTDGRLITLELNPRHAEVARRNVDAAGVGGLVEIRVGAALELLQELERQGGPLFDLSFIDADKVNAPQYFDAALRMSRAGATIVVDNVVRKGALLDEDSTDENVRGMRRLIERVRDEKRVRTTVVQTVGAKGYDGFLMAVVLG
ncbi:MAG: O-methyltransferase [Planctomycetia bacterium]|nr:MAG: O-methyltransferase [Planctomycetia bacterium]